VEKKINRAERAKLFMPFAALKGFEEALREKEKQIEQKKELLEDAANSLNETLQTLKPNMLVTITYYNINKYETITNTIKKIDKINQTILIEDKQIAFETISKIEIK
jgi:deoxyribodipyrimidine photolyase-like uncharacterized protein